MKTIPPETQFFASDNRAIPDISSLDELLLSDGPERGKEAFDSMMKETKFLIQNFKFTPLNALYKAVVMRGVLEPFVAWRKGHLAVQIFLERLSETDPRPRFLPQRLYKYMSLDSTTRQGYARRIILQGEIFHASPSDLNDPDDCRPRIPPEFLEPEFRERIDAQIGIVSFSEDNANHLMWAHYADGERGICVEIDTLYLVHKEESEEIALLPVNYMSSKGVLSTPDGTSSTRNLITLLTIKLSHWSDEKEWRLTKMWEEPPDKKNRCLKLGESLVTAVFVGRRITPRNLEKIELWASRRKTEISVEGVELS